MKTYLIFGEAYCREYDKNGTAGLYQALKSGRGLDGEVAVIDETYEVLDILQAVSGWNDFRVISKEEYEELLPSRDKLIYNVINQISSDINQGNMDTVYRLIYDLSEENMSRLSAYLADDKRHELLTGN